MATVDELQVQISANAASFKKEIGGVQKQLSTLSSSSSKMSGKMIAGFAAVGTIIGNVVTKALSAVTAQVDEAITRLDTLNNFPKVMSNLGIGAEEARKAISYMSDKLTGLPTTLDDAASAVQRFVSANGNLGASTNMFLALNNAILAGGGSAQVQSTALEQLSQAYAKGKPDMMEWRSMMTAMPAQLKQIATAMGYVDSSALGEDLRSGAVSMNDFMATVVKLNNEGVNGFQSFADQAKNATGGVQTSMTNLKTAITRGITSIMDAIGQSNIAGFFNGVAKAINTAANYVAAFVKVIITAINALSALFGAKGAKTTNTATSAAADSVGAIASNADDATGSLNDTGKAAKKLSQQLAGFDEMNVLKEQDSSSGSGSGSSGGSAGNYDLSGMEIDWDGIAGDGVSAIDKIYDRMMKAFGKLDLSKWSKAITNFRIGATKAFKIVENAGKSAWDNMFIPLAQHIAENSLPTFIDDIGRSLQQLDVSSWSKGFDTAFQGLGDALKPVIDGFLTVKAFIFDITTAWANMVVPPALSIIGGLLSTIGSVGAGIVDGFRTVWEGVIQPALDSAHEKLAPIIEDIQSVFEGLQKNEALMRTLKTVGQVMGATLGLAINVVIETVTMLIAVLTIAVDFILHLPEYVVQFFQGMWDTVCQIFQAIGDFCAKIFQGIYDFVSGVATDISDFFTGAWNNMKDGAAKAWEGIKSVFSTVGTFFKNTFQNAWTAVKNVFSTGGKIFDGIKDGIVSAFKTIVNAIIKGINKVVSVPFNAINNALSGIRNIEIVGQKPFSWIPTISVPQIPLLAKGGIASSATLAMIGEAGKEAVLPLENNTSWMDTLASKISANGGQPLTIKIGEETILDTIIGGINDRSFLSNRLTINI